MSDLLIRVYDLIVEALRYFLYDDYTLGIERVYNVFIIYEKLIKEQGKEMTNELLEDYNLVKKVMNKRSNITKGLYKKLLIDCIKIKDELKRSPQET